MALVYSMTAIGKTEPERDICFMFRQKAPFKINSASGAFRVFIKELSLTAERDGYMYKGTVADCEVSGFYNPSQKRGTIVFLREEKVSAFK